MATLALQIVQVRIFSYSINPVYVYMVISLAMLGIGASGTVLSLLPSLRSLRLERALAGCLMGFAASAGLANFAFARLSGFVTADTGLTLISPVTALFFLFVVPYFFSGLGVALVLVSDTERLPRNYFINLIGSGAGCFVVYPFLGRFGAEWVVAAILAFCAVVAAVAWARTSGRHVGWMTGIAVILVLASFVPQRFLPFQPDHSDFYQNLVDEFSEQSGSQIAPKLLFSQWDPVGHVEIFEFPGAYGRFSGDIPAYFFAQDAGAPSNLFGAGSHPRAAKMLGDSSFYGLGTTLRPGGDVLVMGLGGGPDLIAALSAGAGRVTGIEINKAVIDALSGPFRSFLGLPPEDSERFTLVHADGRAFARRFSDRFDVIQMTGADTYAAGSISGSILSENYLYTVEAFEDYFDALKADGILAITRFGVEPFKIVTTASTALLARGVTALSQHFIIVIQGPISVLTLVKAQPFNDAEIARVRSFVTTANAQNLDFSLPAYDVKGFGLQGGLTVLFDPGLVADPLEAETGSAYERLFEPDSDGNLTAASFAFQGLDFSPSTDDRPFFLQFYKLEWPGLAGLFAFHELDNPLAWSVNNYLSIVAQIGLLALLLILGPLVVLRRRGVALAASAPVATYFFAIGMGFMFVEIGLMQRFSLFLGHPNFSISAVLFSLLVFSGLGSWVTGRLRVGLQLRLSVAIAAIVAGVCAFSAFSGSLFNSALGASIEVRIAISIAMLAPIAFFMGMPLPNLLRFTETRYPDFAPWALGVNGFASVLASLATIPLTMALGFQTTFLLGAVAYAIAWLALQVIIRLRPA